MVLPTAVWAQDSLTTVADSLKTTTAIPVEAVAAATEEPTVLNSGNTAWINSSYCACYDDDNSRG
jgi:hypothetical protein